MSVEEQTVADSTPASPVTGYRILLPGQWEQVPLRQGTEEAIQHILTSAFSRIPDQAPQDRVGPYKRELERRFRKAVANAQQGNALDLYLPVRPMNDVSLGASILVSENLLPGHTRSQRRSEPSELAVQLLSRDGVDNADLSSGEIDGALAVRREHIAEAEPDKGVELSSRRVEYIVSVPDDPERWFVAAFSTVGGGDARDELADALVEWFDAVMATFRWRRG